MTDEAALLTAVAAIPNDDTPQLVLADWYDDHDRPADAHRIRGEVHIRAAHRDVLSDPIGDGPRLEYARVCEEWAGEVECEGKCKGYIVPGHYPDDIWLRKPTWLPCPDCSGSGRVPDGRADRAAFVRVQCELAAWDAADARTQFAERDRAASLRRRERELSAGWRRWFMFPPHPAGSSWSCVIDSDEVDGVNDPNGQSATAVVRRGFVDELRVGSLGVLFGGECGRCNGAGGWPVIERVEFGGESRRWLKCPNCPSDTPGRFPGIVKQVFSQHPVTAVGVADMEPESGWEVYGSLRLDRGDSFVWCRAAGNDPGGELVPDEVWELLGGWVQNDGWWKSYPTRAVALDALSAAVVSHCRKLAGLPSLSSRKNRDGN